MLALVNAEAEDVNLKNCALGGSIILSTGGSTFVSAEAVRCSSYKMALIAQLRDD